MAGKIKIFGVPIKSFCVAMDSPVQMVQFDDICCVVEASTRECKCFIFQCCGAKRKNTTIVFSSHHLNVQEKIYLLTLRAFWCLTFQKSVPRKEFFISFRAFHSHCAKAYQKSSLLKELEGQQCPYSLGVHAL